MSEKPGATPPSTAMAAPLDDGSLALLMPKTISIALGAEPPPDAVGNTVFTHRYTLLNFFPVQIYEQLNPFGKFANFYFLCVGCLQAIPQITVTGGVPVLLGPLLFVTGIDAILKLYEDVQRRKADAVTNQQATHVLDPESKAFEPRRWDEVKVGDIVAVRNREIFPADLLLLGADGPEGMTGHVWVSTKSLDGETDAKLREAPKATAARLQAGGLAALAELRGELRCEAPNNITSDFSGVLTLEPSLRALAATASFWQGAGASVWGSSSSSRTAGQDEGEEAMVPVHEDNMLLRGCLLRNTKECYGLVVSCGTQTKIMYSPPSPHTGRLLARLLGARALARLRALADGLAPLRRLLAGGNAGGGAKMESSKVGAMTARVNLDILGIVGLLLALSVAAVALHYTQCARTLGAGATLWYLGLPPVEPAGPFRADGVGLCENPASLFGRYFLLSYNLIPVSLYVSISLVQIWVSLLMAQDLGMYDPAQDQPAIVRNMSLCDELGRISHVLSDKTGTLTANHMRLRRLAVGANVYGSGGALNPSAKPVAAAAGPSATSASAAASHTVAAARPGAKAASMAGGAAGARRSGLLPGQHYGCRRETAPFVSYEEEPGSGALYAALDDGAGGRGLAREARLLLLHLACNHSVLHEAMSSGGTELAASSPDELALVAAAEHFGYEFTKRELSKAQLLVRDKRQGLAAAAHAVQVLAVFPYSSNRKRMTSVVRLPAALAPGGSAGVYAFCKGADSVLLEMLAQPSAGGQSAHYNSAARVRALRRTVGQWADEALRTLVFGMRPVAEVELAFWLRRYRQAVDDPRQRAALKAGVANSFDSLQAEIEAGMLLQGASAVEDQLQVGVPETLRDFSTAGIKVWMLTGDKVGTAKNIAAACSLLPSAKHHATDHADGAAADFGFGFEALNQSIGWLFGQGAQGATPAAVVAVDAVSRATGTAKDAAALAWTRPSERSAAAQAQAAANSVDSTRVIEWTTEAVAGLEDVPAADLAAASEAAEDARAEAARARKGARASPSALVGGLARRLCGADAAARRVELPAALAARELLAALEARQPSLAMMRGACLHEAALLAPAHEGASDSATAAGAPARRSHTLVLDEKAIDWLTAACPREFAALANTARAVIACRCRQEQKAQMVRVVRDNSPMARVLAIGDGANDVAMIKAAHIGIGIAGKEGMQAVQNSDFAIGQFRFLRRLLFYHGRHNYRRLAMLVYYMFYKNVLDRFAQFYFTAMGLYSGQKYWSEVVTTIFNVVYTSLPIIAIAIADQDVPARVAERSPELYRQCCQQLIYTHSMFWSYVVEGLGASLLFFYAILRIYEQPSNDSSLSVFSLGMVAQVSIVVVVNLRLCLDVTNWTVAIVGIFVATFVVFFLSLLMFQETGLNFWSEWWGADKYIFFTTSFGLFALWALAIGLLPKYIREMWGNFFPSDARLAMETVRAVKPARTPKPRLGLLRRGRRLPSASASEDRDVD